MTARVMASADVDANVEIGEGTTVWHLAQIRDGATLGKQCTVGRGVYIGPGVQVGDNVKLQNYALVYEPTRLGDGVFVGPAVVFTNDQYPRAVNPDGRAKRAEDWSAVGVTVLEGASIGARSICVAPITIGRWALVAAGSVVTSDVADFALVAGAPARQLKWVGHAGVPLIPQGEARWRCPQTNRTYALIQDTLVPEDL